MACVFELGGHSAKPYVYVNRVYYCFIVNNFNIFIIIIIIIKDQTEISLCSQAFP